ncbi:RNA polymerase sigma-70 factor, ECF subfamily [Actinokineospora alba]|uniref:RNA polymerase sigma-70 factor, ECF subfamily n=1 Tax=Actinokineospora alba TaxID=504798 RepID=A0A1H0UGC2_9PSEU|nr:RNA polymerase sigma factor ShbA [Actinokineospora alba]TDP65129.1 RNA polymerase sigma-70 factor (ECF subfamily) [Actinokineospora alba]SDH54738.1 RNA polymerase sigma-70 factor, ECF subfamily [Actinokineospora alba]SDP64906.1 RNA polymerase sigma-70 factor, ECF subfamily [Actinokineospora alba]
MSSAIKPVGSDHDTTVSAPAARSQGTDAIFTRLKSSAFHELVAASLQGDREAIGTLFAWINPAIIRYCRARIGRTGSAYSSADDVAQEILLAVLGALPRYHDNCESFLPFVYGIASHKVADFYRRSGRDRSEPVAELPETMDVGLGPEQLTLRGEMRTRLVSLLDTLAPRQREILVLRLVVGLSAQETATAIGLTATAVRVAQHRALTRLRGALQAGDWLG